MAVAGDLRDAGTLLVQDAASIEATGVERATLGVIEITNSRPFAYIATGKRAISSGQDQKEMALTEYIRIKLREVDMDRKPWGHI